MIGYGTWVAPLKDSNDFSHWFIKNSKPTERAIPLAILGRLHAMADMDSPVSLREDANFFQEMSQKFRASDAKPPVVEQVAIFDAKAYLDADAEMKAKMMDAVKTDADGNETINRVIVVSSGGGDDIPAMLAVKYELESEGLTVSPDCFRAGCR